MPRREDEFFTLLRQLSDIIAEASHEYVAIMEGFPATSARIPRMQMYEVKADECVREIMERLYTSFVTPIDREDISELALALDDIVDGMEKVSLRLDLFNIEKIRPEAIEMTKLTHQAVTDACIMIDRLPAYRKDRTVMEKSISVGHIEDGADTVYENALRRLFHEDGVGGKESVAWLRLFDRQERCLDACDHAARVVRNVVMKSA